MEETTAPLYDTDEAYEFIMDALEKRGFERNCHVGEIVRATLDADYAYMCSIGIIEEDEDEGDLFPDGDIDDE